MRRLASKRKKRFWKMTRRRKRKLKFFRMLFGLRSML